MDRFPDLHIVVEDDPHVAADEIRQHLLAALGSRAAPNFYRELAVLARDREGALVAGLVGDTAYGWLAVQMLWVVESLRGGGLGATLMRRAEEEALSRGCHGAWLETSSRRAEAFYGRIGYEVFGALENRAGEWPEGHRRAFMRKRLA